MLRKILIFGALLLAHAPASAAWQRAETKHFVIYSEQRPADLHAFATKLEKFDRAVRLIRLMDDPPVGLGNRLTVFVLSNDAAVRKLLGDKSGMVQGYYIGRASGSVAFVPRKTDANSDEDLRAETVFFHEYAHHLMMQVLNRPLPEWLVEGFAEFLSTARFRRDGAVVLGAPALHRAWGIYDKDGGLPIEKLLSNDYDTLTVEQTESLYARGWLLVHYLTFEPKRAGQIDRYVNAIASGVAPLEAARSAFGDLRQLDRDLDRYRNRGTLTSFVFGPEKFTAPAVYVAPLSEGASRAVLLRARTESGVDEKTAEPTAAEARQLQRLYPGDELVELELAEAELDADHPEAAEAAADRALKANPRNTEAMVLKGRAIVERARAAKGDAHPLFEQARAIFIAANKIDTEDPEPLKEFYESFQAEGVRPTPNAIAALHYASNLAPQDSGLRMNSAYRYIADGKVAEAKRVLAPLAYDPHKRSLAKLARKMLDKLAAGDAKGALTVAETSD